MDKDELIVDLRRGIYRIGAYTFGYTRDVDLFEHVETGIGANFSAYSLPGSIKPVYGDHPVGANMYLRLRLRRGV